MNADDNSESYSISDLLMKLCNRLAQNDQNLTSILSKHAFQMVSLSSLNAIAPSDEPYYLMQIRDILLTQPKEHQEKFEMMYTNIAKSSILTQRTAILCFLYNLSKNQNETRLLSISKDLGKLRPQSNQSHRSRSNVGLSNTPSLENYSIKQIFERNDKRFNSNSASLRLNSGRVQSQATTVSSVTWSRSNVPSSSRVSSYNSATEYELLQDVIYSFQGIEGKYLRKEPGSLGFTIDPKVAKSLSPIQRGSLERLIGVSFLHKQLKLYCEENEKQSGTICQALIAILSDELSEYYKMVALMQASMSKQNSRDQGDMTLRRAWYMIHDHRIRFEWLAYLAESCSDKKGGALVTAVHGFLQHGSSCAQEVAERVLKAVCKPLYIMLSRWLLDGEIHDPCNEFFVEVKSAITAERLWHDKYHVRKTMLPSFITMGQARKILATGKSINFLRQICKDGGQLPGRESLQKLFRTTSAEALFTPEQSIEFHSTLENVYKETSLRVLDLLKNKYKLYEHLQSLRRYLLLGQGDFIRHLLELLIPELNKPAEDIYGHTLTAILESAIRVTNAQYEDEDTLKRLNVSCMSHSQGDLGWDVFSLVYIVDGPIGTIFQPTMLTYQSLFGALWKAKRIEYILANMRRQQLTMTKLFRDIKELKPVMHVIHILTSKMIHFIHQTQYYFLFEVLECSWAEMQNHVNKAECLDDIILAHTNFLNSIQKGVLLDEKSRPLFSHLLSIYSFVVNLEGHQEALYEAATAEYNAHIEYRRKADSTQGFEITTQEEAKAKKRRDKFHQFLHATKLKVKTSSLTYDDIVLKFLELLAANSDMNLQLLSVRFSFNRYYKIA